MKIKSVPWEIKVTWRMYKYKELFGNRYLKAKETGEVEYIDEDLSAFLGGEDEKQKD